MMSHLLKICNFVSKTFQSPTLDNAAVADQVKALMEEIAEEGSDY